MVRVLQRSPVREIRTPGSARGLSGNRQFYLNRLEREITKVRKAKAEHSGEKGKSRRKIGFLQD